MNIVQSIMLSVLIAYSFGAVPAQAASAKSEVTVNPGVLEYARTYRVSVDEAEWRLSKLRYIGEMGNRIETASPGTFAGIWIEHTPAFRVVVRFVGNSKAQLAEYTQDPLFVPQTAPRSYEALIAAQADIADRLAKAGIDFTSDIDLKKSEIKLYVQDPAAVLRQFAVVFRVSPFIRVYKGSGFVDLTGISGGGRVRGPTTAVPNCTTGFNVFDGNRELGITTAGHCNDEMTYVPTKTRLNFQGESNAGNYDIQWHKQRIPQSATPKQQEDSIDLINGLMPSMKITGVTPSSSYGVGEPVCKSGISGQYLRRTVVNMNHLETIREWSVLSFKSTMSTTNRFQWKETVGDQSSATGLLMG